MLTFKDNWQELLSQLYALAVTDPVPENAAASVRDVYPGTLCATPEEITQDIITAITRNDRDSFYEKYCIPPLLVLTVISDKAFAKDSLQFELSVILSVRTVQKKKALLISAAPLRKECFLNTSLRMFFSPGADFGEPHEEYCRRKLTKYLEKVEKYPGYLDEEEIMELIALDGRNRNIVCQGYRKNLEQLQAEVQALKQRFREITKEP